MTDSVHFLSIFFTSPFVTFLFKSFAHFYLLGLSLYCHMEIFIYLGIFFFSVSKKYFANNFFQVVIYWFLTVIWQAAFLNVMIFSF